MMKREWKEAAAAVVMGLLVPYILLNAAALWFQKPDPYTNEPETTAPEQPEDVQIKVLVGDRLKTMGLEEYLTGVVLGEMPASFELEALKAQAVVARTYTLRRWESGSKHINADICTDPSCCQAYQNPDSYTGSRELVDKVRSAVKDTWGMVLTYEGALIEATYFSSSGGRTEDAQAVWGSDLPYLQATDSPEDGYAEKYMHTVSFTADEFRNALDRKLTGDCTEWFGNTTYTNGGGVDTMVIGGREYAGTELRQLLGLRSTAFTVSVFENRITITTRGYDHRVGMSQYGAEAMAVAGNTFDEILSHYYQGTVLEEYIDNG